MRLLSIAAFGAFLSAGAAVAAPVMWTISGATFTDGGTLTGSFVYDADIATIVSFSLSTAGGNTSTFTPYTFSSTSDVVQNRPYGFRFISSTSFPPYLGPRELRISPVSALTDAGGTIALQTNGFTGECYNCAPFRGFATPGSITSGTAAVPEPASWAMMVGGFGLLGSAMRRRKVAVSFS